MTDTPLKPCPFCGGEADIVDVNLKNQEGGESWVAGCDNCQVYFADDESGEAIAAWNRRPAQIYTQDQLDAAVRAERKRILSHIDCLIESLQEGLMTDAGLSKLDRQKMRAQIDALEVAAAAIREGQP